MRCIRIILVTLLLASCSKYNQKIIVPVSSKSQKIILKSNNEGNIYSINIRCSGYVDGEAKIMLMLNEKSYKTKNISGNISVIWGGDWYSDSATIIYKPINANKGEIEVEYKFNEIS